MRAWAGLALVLAIAGGLPCPALAEGGRLLDKLVPEQSKVRGKEATFVRVPLDAFDIRVLTPLIALADLPSARPDQSQNIERKARGLFLQDYQRRFRAIAVLSGGYVSAFSPPTPLGFVKSDGVAISSAHESWLTEGLLCSDEGRFEVRLKTRPIDRPEFRDCLQAGPLLLVNGNPPNELPSRRASGYNTLARSVQEQTFACVDRRRNVVLGVTAEIELAALVEWIRRPEIDCVDAIRLTGQATAGLRVNNELFGNDEYLLPSALAVMPRTK